MFINLCSNCNRRILVKSSQIRYITTTVFRLAQQRTYYEVLGVKNDCSSKEIKNAYINLSKMHHPDKNPVSAENDTEFKQILEAYSVLSKPHSRENYDLTLRGIHTVSYITNDTVHRPWESSQNRYQNVDPDNYYGIKGVKKMQNWKIVLACAIFCGIGVVLQILAITKSVTFRRDKIFEQSAIYNEMHKKKREETLSSDDSENLKKMVNRMLEKTQ